MLKVQITFALQPAIMSSEEQLMQIPLLSSFMRKDRVTWIQQIDLY